MRTPELVTRPIGALARGLLAMLAGAVLSAGCQTAPGAVTSAPEGPVRPGAARIEALASAGSAAAPLGRRADPPRRIGLALGGGAARGFAHIGVIQVLEAEGIKPDLVVGTSAGSLVAALVADGKTGAEMESLALTLDESTLTDWSLPSRGVLRGDALARWVRLQTAGKPIEQMRVPLGIVATDLATGAGTLFQRGDTGLAVRASSAVPAVFQPVRIADREYVDGGLVAPVPVRYARQMGATHVIAVDISTPPEGGATDGTLGLLLQTFAIMGKNISGFELREADVVLRPALPGLAGTDFSNRVRAIRAGRETTLAMLPQLREKLGLPPR